MLVTITDPIGRTYDDLNRLTSASHVQLVRGFTGLLQSIRLFFGRAL